MKRRLLFFSEYYHPNPNSTSFFFSGIVKEAAQAFHGPLEVTCAISCPPEQELNLGDNVQVKRLFVPGLNKNRLIGRIVKLLWISIGFAWRALWCIHRNDVVFTVTNPAFWMCFLAILRKFRKFEYVLLVYDIFPEVLPASGLCRKESFRYRLTKKIFDWSYHQVDRLVVIGRDMQEVCEAKGCAGKCVMIPNWSDECYIHPEERAQNALLDDLKLTQKRVFTLLGNIGRTQGIDSLLEAIRQTTEKDAAFLFIGSGASKTKIDEFIAAHPDKLVKSLGYLPNSEQLTLLNACDVAMISLAPGMYGLSVPSKSYFNMAAGKPLLLIADRRSEIGRVIDEEKNGWQIDPGESELLAKKIDEITRMPLAELEEKGKRSRRLAETRFASKTILSRYNELFTAYND